MPVIDLTNGDSDDEEKHEKREDEKREDEKQEEDPKISKLLLLKSLAEQDLKKAQEKLDEYTKAKADAEAKAKAAEEAKAKAAEEAKAKADAEAKAKAAEEAKAKQEMENIFCLLTKKLGEIKDSIVHNTCVLCNLEKLIPDKINENINFTEFIQMVDERIIIKRETSDQPELILTSREIQQNATENLQKPAGELKKVLYSLSFFVDTFQEVLKTKVDAKQFKDIVDGTFTNPFSQEHRSEKVIEGKKAVDEKIEALALKNDVLHTQIQDLHTNRDALMQEVKSLRAELITRPKTSGDSSQVAKGECSSQGEKPKIFSFLGKDNSVTKIIEGKIQYNARYDRIVSTAFELALTRAKSKSKSPLLKGEEYKLLRKLLKDAEKSKSEIMKTILQSGNDVGNGKDNIYNLTDAELKFCVALCAAAEKNANLWPKILEVKKAAPKKTAKRKRSQSNEGGSRSNRNRA